jgi:predicted heme/steroid binding protein
VLSANGPVWATEQYARETGRGCIFCHQDSTGGQLKTAGLAYIRGGYHYPIPQAVLQKSETLQRPLHKTIRFVVGYLHLLAAVVFFGAIFYIHIFIRPATLSGGIPKAERMLGVSCMLLLTFTGIYLTWVRIDRWEQFFDNTFGWMLFIKILLFAAMVLIGLCAITIVHRRMKKESRPAPETGVSRDNLSRYDGSSGRPAYFVYDGILYDVSESTKWKEGRHFGKHVAGTDLTKALGGAPHGTEVLENVRNLGPLAASSGTPARPRSAQRIFVWMAYSNLVIIFLILACISVWRWDFPVRLVPERRTEALTGQRCVDCHRKQTPGIFLDWEKSVHARLDVHCYKCHRANNDASVLVSHLTHDPKPISVVVTPKNCGGCHPDQTRAYARSKHANTWEIMWKVDHWLNDDMNNRIERISGCYSCHGTVVTVENGQPAPGSWPNVGVGRVNPDGSKGSCSSCHTRHRFSIAEARKPEACDQCHLGPDHPQIEIYNESKHGTIYHAEGHEWDWSPRDGEWRAARDFRTPTCAACHMSAAGALAATHDTTERLAWETQAPLTVRPENFAPFPAATDWRREREKMERVCRQCHSRKWTTEHFRNLDAVVANYNDTYYLPIKALMDELYAAGRLSRERYFDEPLEWEFYELWHHEGRRARMGAAMMAPDYAWWHGFYELKLRFNRILQARSEIERAERPIVYERFPGRHH